MLCGGVPGRVDVSYDAAGEQFDISKEIKFGLVVPTKDGRGLALNNRRRGIEQRKCREYTSTTKSH